MASTSTNDDLAMISQQRGQNEIEKGKVGQVRQQFQVHEDTALAYKIQNQEIENHVCHNRQQRRSVRDGVKTAKETFLEEVKFAGFLPDERLIEIEQKQWLAEELHKRVEEQEEATRKQKEQQTKEDEELASQYQRQEELQMKYYEQKRLDKLNKAEEEHRRLRNIMKDLEEANIATNNEEDEDVEIDLIPELPHGNDIITLADGTIIDAKENEIKTEAEKKEHLEKKDQELAKILQEQEDMQNAKQKHIDRDLRKAMELQDREIAKHLQRKEKARAERRQEQMRRGQSLPEGNEVMSSQRRQRHLPTYHEALGINDLEKDSSSFDDDQVGPSAMNDHNNEERIHHHRSRSQGDECQEGSRGKEKLEFLVLQQEDGAHYNNIAETLDPTFVGTSRHSSTVEEGMSYQLSHSESEHVDEQNKGATIVPPMKRKSSKDRSKRKFWNF